MPEFMKPELAVCHLLAGGELRKYKQPYTVVYKNGQFKCKDTGTLIGDFNQLYLEI